MALARHCSGCYRPAPLASVEAVLRFTPQPFPRPMGWRPGALPGSVPAPQPRAEPGLAVRAKLDTDAPRSLRSCLRTPFPVVTPARTMRPVTAWGLKTSTFSDTTDMKHIERDGNGIR